MVWVWAAGVGGEGWHGGDWVDKGVCSVGLGLGLGGLGLGLGRCGRGLPRLGRRNRMVGTVRRLWWGRTLGREGRVLREMSSMGMGAVVEGGGGDRDGGEYSGVSRYVGMRVGGTGQSVMRGGDFSGKQGLYGVAREVG